MKTMLSWLVVSGLMAGTAEAARLRCPSAKVAGSTLVVNLVRGATPKSLEGEHRYNKNTSVVRLSCDRQSPVVAGAVVYTCADATYGQIYARLALSPLAFQGAPKFPVKITFLDENTEEPVGKETFNCGG